MAQMNILLVDDDPEDCLIMAEAVSDCSSGSTLRYVSNGEFAIETLNVDFGNEQLPDLILLDFNMPRMNGRETLEQIKKDTRFQDIPVILYSTTINPMEREACMRMGAQEFLRKPISLEESLDLARMLTSLNE